MAVCEPNRRRLQARERETIPIATHLPSRLSSTGSIRNAREFADMPVQGRIATSAADRPPTVTVRGSSAVEELSRTSAGITGPRRSSFRQPSLPDRYCTVVTVPSLPYRRYWAEAALCGADEPRSPESPRHFRAGDDVVCIYVTPRPRTLSPDCGCASEQPYAPRWRTAGGRLHSARYRM